MKTTAVLSAVMFLSTSAGVTAQSGLYFSEDNNPKGLYLIDPATGATKNIGLNGVVSGTVGLAPTAVPTDLYGSSPWDLLRTKTDGSGAGTIGPGTTEALAYHRSTSTLYGALNGSFFTLDPLIGGIVTNLPNPSGDDFEGLTFDIRRGVVWALPGFADSDTWLYYYTPDTGLWTRYMDTQIDWSEGSLAYDPKKDMLYIKDTVTSALIGIDVPNRNLFKIGDTRLNTGGGLAFVPEPVTLESTRYHLNAGDQFQLTTYDGLPGGACAVAVVDVSGKPLFQIVYLKAFDAAGQLQLPAVAPPGLSGLTATFLSFGFAVGPSLEMSNPMTLNFL